MIAHSGFRCTGLGGYRAFGLPALVLTASREVLATSVVTVFLKHCGPRCRVGGGGPGEERSFPPCPESILGDPQKQTLTSCRWGLPTQAIPRNSGMLEVFQVRQSG